jgi:RNA polymerase sigma-70 factor (ECF subfamily)
LSDTGFSISHVLLADAAEPLDVQLIAGMAQGDERAAAILYDRHGAVMYGLALRVVGEPADAEEVVLDAFAQAWREAGRYDTSRGAVAGWLTTITRTRALYLIRARGRRAKATDAATATLDEPAAMGSGFAMPDVEVQETERAVAVKSALDQLPLPQRQAIELAFFEGLTHHEVADRLREPLGTVKTRIRLGMQKLRDTLAGLGPERV